MFRLLLITSLTFGLLTACGGGGGGGSSASGVAPERPFGAVEGVVQDGLVSGATVIVYAVNSDGTIGEELGRGTSDSDGQYSIPIQAADQVVFVSASGGSYVEESTGVSVSLNTTARRSQALRTYVNYRSGDDVVGNITPYTNLGAGLVEYLLSQGESFNDAIDNAFTNVNAMVGFDVRATLPVNVLDESNVFAELDESVQYGFLLAGISQLTQTLNQNAGQAPHVLFSSFDFVSLMYADIRVDGVLNGFGAFEDESPEQLTFVGDDIDTSSYREALSQSIIEFVESENNAIDLNAPDVLDFAVSIGSNAGDVFDNRPAAPIDDAGPSLGDLEDAPLRGEVTFDISADDFVGVNQVTFFLDGEALNNAEDPENPSLSLTTTDYAVGSHTLRVTATDNLGNVATRDYQVFFAPPSGAISGYVLDGTATEGTVSFYEVGNTGTKGALIDTAAVDGNGFYSTSLAALEQPVLVEFTDGSYKEPATGVSVQFDGNDSVAALINFVPEQSIAVNINAWSHGAYSLALAKVGEGEALTEAVASAQNDIINLLNLDYRSTQPIGITETINEFTALTDNVRSELIFAGVSQLTSLHDEHDQYTSIGFVDALYDDFSDGDLDGMNGDDAISYAGSSLSANTSRTDLARSIISFVNGEEFALQLGLDVISPFALFVSTNESALYLGVEGEIYDVSGPTISITVPQELFESESIVMAAQDSTGVASVEYFLDGESIESVNDAGATFSFDTGNYTSGEHTLSVVAIDNLGNSRTSDTTLFFMPPFGSITGVSDYRGGSASLYRLSDDGALGELIASSGVSGQGTYSFNVQVLSGPTTIRVTGGTYTEPASGRSVSQGDSVISAVLNYVEGQSHAQNISTWTHGVTGIALYNANVGGEGADLSEEITAAYAQMNTFLGVDISSTTPIDITDENNEFAALIPATNLALINAGVSQLMANISTSVGDAPHARFTSLTYANTLYEDASADGFLNGAGITEEGVYGTLSIAETLVSANTYRASVAGGIVGFIQTDDFALDRQTGDLLPLALSLQNANTAIFADIPTTTFDNSGPTVGVPGGSNEYDATVEIPFTLTDYTGVASVEFRLDGTQLGTVNGSSLPSITINTEEYADGNHTLSIDATDILGNTSTELYPVYFLPDVGLVAGSAHDGPIINGTVTAYEYGTNNVYATTTTDNVGEYSLSLQELDSTTALEVTDGYYIEEFSGTRINLDSGQSLRANTFYEAGASISLSLTFYTHWAACYTEYLVAEEGLTVGNAIRNASEAMTNLAGNEISTVKPLDVTNPDNFTNFTTPGHEYGYVLAGWSGVSEAIALENGVDPHSSAQYSSIYMADVICRDIRYDGLMDGLGEPSGSNPSGQLYIGATALSPHYYRTILAQKILEFAANEDLNGAGLTAPDLLEMANAISTNPSALFAGVPSRPVDIEGPSISSTVAENTLFNETVAVPIVVEDPIGVSSVAFYVDDVFLANGNLADLAASINTENYADGSHTLRVVALDALNNESTFELPLTFINSGAGISITSSDLVNTTSYAASGTYTEVGAPIDSIVVEGVSADINDTNGTWSVALTLNAGVNTVDALITDALGNTNSTSMDVGVDIESPSITAQPLPALFSTGGTTISSCDSGELVINETLGSPLCLDATLTALGGSALSNDLLQQGYIVFSATVVDPNNNGVSTNNEDLLVEYRYLRNSNIVQNWSVAPLMQGSSNQVFIPLTTEYFGPSFFQSDVTVEHELTLRVIDNAGNSASVPTTINLEVYTPDLIIADPVITNAAIFEDGFSSRSSLRGAEVYIDYTLTNETNVPYYIQLDFTDENTFDHSWEIAERFHAVRREESEQWRIDYNTPFYFCIFDCDASILPGADEYELIEGIYNYQDGDFVWVAVPEPEYGPIVNMSVDSLPGIPSGSWIDFEIDDEMATYSGGGCRIYYDYLQDLGSYASGSLAPHSSNTTVLPSNDCREWDIDEKTTTLQFQNLYRWVSESGYPRNEIDSYSETVDFFLDSESVLINSEEQSSVSGGWYLIPANTTATIRKTYTLPNFTVYDDMRVAANDSTVPYDSAIGLDSQVVWDFSTELNVSRSIAPSTGFSNNVVRNAQAFDTPNESFSLSR